jgi:glyoxylase-like metal-dependent hydrolase (beta-lactamase superfamily II)
MPQFWRNMDVRDWRGELEGRVMFTPGHTPACSAYVIGDAVFVGDGGRSTRPHCNDARV